MNSNLKKRKKQEFKIKVLRNGLRILSAPIAGAKTVTILAMYGTGSKYETREQNGLSHFVEHMLFKGTKKRSGALIVSRDMDSLGGEYNAFTSKEYTGYWVKVDSKKIEPAMEILSDMVLNSRFSQADIDRERGVIIEEINMYHENPMMYIEDVFESCLYGDSPAGWDVAGPKENIRSFRRADFLGYFQRQYGADSAALCLAGDIDSQVEKMVEKYFSAMKKSSFKDKEKIIENQKAPAIKLHYKGGDQANLAVGVRAFNNYHPDKIVLKLLSVVLGGSMSSRLFTEVREKRGLAYSVHSSCEFYTDTGYLVTYAGVPTEKKDEAIKVILAEYKKMCSRLISNEELKRAKDMIKGRTIIGFEESDNVANWYARQAIMKDEIVSTEEYFKKINTVGPKDLRRVAKEIFKDEKLNLAAIGPFRKPEEFKEIVKF